MMRKIYFLLTFTVLLTFPALAQNGSISGKLIDFQTQEPVSFANIAVLQQADSALVTGRATDNNGAFTIPIANGSYIVRMSFIGYHNAYRNVQITDQAQRVQLDTILMVTDNILLEDAMIVAKAPEIIMRGDTIEYNADSYRVQEGAVVEELVRLMPGMEVDSEGRVTNNGRRISRVMVNNEEFFSSDPTVALQNLPADMVERIQVMERQSDRSRMTGFADGEEEFVLNLVTRPGTREAIVGNGRTGYGSDNRYGVRGMFNYSRNSNRYTIMGGTNNTNNIGFQGGGMRGRGSGGGFGFGGSNNGISTARNVMGDFSHDLSSQLKIGGSTGFRNNDTEVITESVTERIRQSGNRIEQSDNRSNSIGYNYNMEFRFEWKPNALTEIIFRPSASYNTNSRRDEGTSNTRELAGDTINHGNSRSSSEGNGTVFGGSLNASRRLGDSGRVLNLQMDGNQNDSQSEGWEQSNTYFTSQPDIIRDLRSDNSNSSRSWRGSLSYVEPVGERSFIQLAYTYRQNLSESDRNRYSKDENGLYSVLDTALSRRTDNSFATQIAELNFRSEHGVLRYRLGFSVRPTSSQNKTYRAGDLENDLTQKVINYAPVAQFNFRWNRSHTLDVRYNGVTNQPSMEQLSPVVDVSNPTNIRYGNPDLKPSFTHEVTSRYQRANPERARSLNASANVRYLTNAVVSSSFENEAGIREFTFENVSGNWNSGGNVTINVPLRNLKYSAFSTSEIKYNHTSGFIDREINVSNRTELLQELGLNYRTDAFNFSIRGNVSTNAVHNSLDKTRNQEFYNYGGRSEAMLFLPWDLTASSDITYSAGAGYADGFNINEWMWNASVQKSLFRQKNGTLGFNIYDILQQRRNISRTVTANYIRDTTTSTITSFFMVNFSYRFNIFRGGATRENMMPRGGDFQRGHGGGERMIFREGGGQPQMF
jgi:hypothetical protein